MPKRSFSIPPVAASARQLLADLVCTPVSMRNDRFFATVGDIHGALSAPAPSAAQILARIAAPRGDLGDSEPELWPWEEPIFRVEAGLATVFVDGALVKGYSDFLCWYWGLMSIDRLQATLEQLAADQNVRTIKLRLNTPGGVSTGMPETADLIMEIDRAVKPVIAFTSDCAASNGMRLAVACRGFIATRSAIVGSIGTYLAVYDYTKYLEDLGIKLEMFRDGSLKGIGTMGKELTADEKKFLQESIDRSGGIFKDLVRARRPGVQESTMQGQWFDAAYGQTLGLVDLIASSEAEVDAVLIAGLLPV